MGRLPYQQGVGEYRRPAPDSHHKPLDISLVRQRYRKAAQVRRHDTQDKLYVIYLNVVVRIGGQKYGIASADRYGLAWEKIPVGVKNVDLVVRVTFSLTVSAIDPGHNQIHRSSDCFCHSGYGRARSRRPYRVPRTGAPGVSSSGDSSSEGSRAVNLMSANLLCPTALKGVT